MIDDCSGHQNCFSRVSCNLPAMKEVDWLVSDP